MERLHVDGRRRQACLRLRSEDLGGAIHELGETHGVNTPITTMMTIMLYALERSVVTPAEPQEHPPAPAEE